MSQSDGAENTFFLVTLYNFQKSGRAIALPAPAPPRSLVSWYRIIVTACHLLASNAAALFPSPRVPLEASHLLVISFFTSRYKQLAQLPFFKFDCPFSFSVND